MASLLTKPSAISRQLLHEAREHPPHFADLGVELTMGLGGEVPQVASEEQLVLGLARRASGDAEEASQFALAFATASLGHVRGDREQGPARTPSLQRGQGVQAHEAPTRPRPYQTNRPHLQVLPHGSRPANAARWAPHPRDRAPTDADG